MRRSERKQIGDRLKPLGFRKKGNHWHKDVGTGFVFTVDAQKSAYSDQYYMNLSLKPKDDIFFGDCYCSRIEYPEGIVDWQLMPEDEFIMPLERAIEEVIKPVMETPFAELGKMRWLQECCICQRTKCKQCWVEKNIWELKNEDQNPLDKV